MEKNAIAIVVLNWNNAPDTIDCVESLLHSITEVNLTIFITDNGSEDDSVSRFIRWLNGKNIEFSHFNTKKSIWKNPVSKEHPSRICLLENDENLGFAKGNNVALHFALEQYPVDFDRYLLLNNDTIVPGKSLRRLLETANKHPDFKAWTPVICYADEREKVWNAGGFLIWWGERKYIAHKQPRNSLPTKGIRQITFITGCALLMDRKLLEDGIFLNEDFFFGEEDYYFSKQMKRLNLKMGVAFESVIYHKVGTSSNHISPKSQLPLLLIHFMNRIVDMKKWMNPLTFAFWKPGFVLHAVFNTWWKRWYSFSVLWKFTRLLVKHSRGKSRVTREDFFGAGKLFVNDKV